MGQLGFLQMQCILILHPSIPQSRAGGSKGAIWKSRL
jgi:hypothetical protein